MTVQLVWAKSLGGFGDNDGYDFDASYGIAVDSFGNVYTTGEFWGLADFDPGANEVNLNSAGLTDLFLSKLDSDGNYVWVKQTGNTFFDSGKGLVVDGADNIYASGYFQDSVQVGESAFTSAGNGDSFISKLSNTGNYIVAESVGTSTQDNYVLDITLDKDTNVYTTGYFWETLEFPSISGSKTLNASGIVDILVTKFDSDGNSIWATSFGNSGNENSFDITTDNAGNVYITGYFTGDGDVEPGAGVTNLSNAGDWDIVIAKFDSTGSFAWAKGIGSTGEDVGNGVLVDEAGNLYVTGSFREIVNFDSGITNTILESEGEEDAFFAKFNSNGTLLWAKSFGGSGNDIGGDLAFDATGNIYLTGTFENTADFDPSLLTTNLTSNGAEDIFVAKFDSNGDLIWAESMGGSGDESLVHMAVESDNIYLTGAYQGTADFNPSSDVVNLTSNGSQDIFVVKLKDLTSTSEPNDGQFGSAPPLINFNAGEKGITLKGSKEKDILRGTAKRDVLGGEGNSDRLYGKAGNDVLSGGSGKDELSGDDDNDRLKGGGSNDNLKGGDGHDLFVGNSGNDKLIGGDGDDILTGGEGIDILTGGAGKNLYVFKKLTEGNDKILQFNQELDLIDLRKIFSANVYDGLSSFEKFTQYIQIEQVGSNTEIKFDLDGQGSGIDTTILATLIDVQATLISTSNFIID